MSDHPLDMVDAAAKAVDPDHELVVQLFVWHPPANDKVAETMDAVRGDFIDLAHTVVALVPRTPMRTYALHSLHRACMDTIASIACNQNLIGES
jgi:hypothetical protein